MKTIEDKLFNPQLLLENDRVKLRIITMGDIDQLSEVALDSNIWTYFTVDISNESDLKEFVSEAIKSFNHRQRVSFVIIDKQTNKAVGMSSFGNISVYDKRIEIGWSWLGVASQGTGINRLYKNLMLQFAFEELEFVRVEFKTDILNKKARKALLKIGTTEEGVLRSHTLMHHDRRRDTIYYSLLNNEWDLLRKKV